MKTIISTITAGLIFAVLAYLSGWVAPSTAFLVGTLLVLALRVKRALAIGEEIDYLEDTLSDRYDDVYQLSQFRPPKGCLTDVVQEIDATNEDRDNLKRRQW